VSANISRAKYLKPVISPLLKIQTFYYMFIWFWCGFFFNPGTRVQLWPIQVVRTQTLPAVYPLTLLCSETLIVKKIEAWLHQILKANDHSKTQHLLMSVKQTPASESRGLRKPCSPW